MNEELRKAVEGFLAIDKYSFSRSDEGKKWAEENGLDMSEYQNIQDMESFFRIASMIGKDDKYISEDFLVRNCPKAILNSYFVSLIKKYDIKRIVVTVEANAYLISSLMSIGYKAEPINIELTDKWGKDNYWAEQNKVVYGHGILLTRD